MMFATRRSAPGPGIAFAARPVLGLLLALGVAGLVSCGESQESDVAIHQPTPTAAAGAAAAASGNVLTVTDATFKQEVLESDTPVLVDFWASWCAPCQMVAPTIEELSGEFQGRVKFGKVDVDANAESTRAYGINAIPCIILFHKGKVVTQFVGVQPKETYAAALAKLAPPAPASASAQTQPTTPTPPAP